MVGRIRYLRIPVPWPAGAGIGKPSVFMQNGMLEEVVAVGFSFGDERSPRPASMPTSHATRGFGRVRPRHPGAAWYPDAGLMVLPWNAVCADADPIASVVAFADRVTPQPSNWAAGLPT